ncbi:hypothetical protein QBC46DRAFT_342994 [Diplogelasinospora grovesii]|uniref:Uncharacterized protein n=1 Tax=Diplogelasinospora grovesii TaxID=303347 RepID=A0AAN6N739_9PEZI|nr:hypothetical protein QBC46DRAFT_342994 [Diplogelasinospora grovesii]
MGPQMIERLVGLGRHPGVCHTTAIPHIFPHIFATTPLPHILLPAPTYPAPTYPAPTYPAPTYHVPTYPPHSYPTPTYPATTYAAPPFAPPARDDNPFAAPPRALNPFAAPRFPPPGYAVNPNVENTPKPAANIREPAKFTLNTAYVREREYYNQPGRRKQPENRRKQPENRRKQSKSSSSSSEDSETDESRSRPGAGNHRPSAARADDSEWNDEDNDPSLSGVGGRETRAPQFAQPKHNRVNWDLFQKLADIKENDSEACVIDILIGEHILDYGDTHRFHMPKALA